MSPSVFSSRNIILSSADRDLRIIKPEVKKVKRVLFGPIDRLETKRFIERELKNVDNTKSEKWNINFETGCILEGLYEWRPSTPRKQITPIKRKLESDIDISEQYFKLPSEGPAARPIKCSSPTQSGETHKVQQSRITDFMKAIKRTTPCDVSKKQQQTSSEWNADIPTKRPRLDIVS